MRIGGKHAGKSSLENKSFNIIKPYHFTYSSTTNRSLLLLPRRRPRNPKTPFAVNHHRSLSNNFPRLRSSRPQHIPPLNKLQNLHPLLPRRKHRKRRLPSRNLRRTRRNRQRSRQRWPQARRHCSRCCDYEECGAGEPVWYVSAVYQ